MADVVIREWVDEKGWIHRMEIPLKTFLREHDFEAVVRCKDCKRYRHDDVFHRWYCSIGMTKRATSKDDYCSWGERREDETN